MAKSTPVRPPEPKPKTPSEPKPSYPQKPSYPKHPPAPDNNPGTKRDFPDQSPQGDPPNFG